MPKVCKCLVHLSFATSNTCMLLGRNIAKSIAKCIATFLPSCVTSAQLLQLQHYKKQQPQGNYMQQIIQRLNDIQREEKRRKNSPLARYNKGKVHQKQMAFHQCLKRNRWVFGGNRSGKTECGAVETVWLARGIHPFRPNKDDVSCWVVSLSQQVQRDVAQQKILHYLDLFGRIYL